MEFFTCIESEDELFCTTSVLLYSYQLTQPSLTYVLPVYPMESNSKNSFLIRLGYLSSNSTEMMKSKKKKPS